MKKKTMTKSGKTSKKVETVKKPVKKGTMAKKLRDKEASEF